MKNKSEFKTINKLIYASVFTLIICVIFIVAKYIGINALIIKIIKAFIPVFVAVFISFIIEPIIGMFLKRGIQRKYSVLLSYGLLLAIIALILILTLPSLVKQLDVFVDSIPSLIGLIDAFIDGLGIKIGNDVGNVLNSILINFSSNFIRSLSSSFSGVFDILLGVSGAIFLSFDFPEFREGVKKCIPNGVKEPVIFYFQIFLPFVHKYFLGVLIDSLFIFAISVIGFSIVGIEYTLVISLFIALTNLIPIIGPYIGGIPAVIIGFSVSSTLGISALIVVVIVQFIESTFLQPIILKNVISLHPLEGILGISLFGALFGVTGMILSPIIIVAVKLLFLPYDKNKDFAVQ